MNDTCASAPTSALNMRLRHLMLLPLLRAFAYDTTFAQIPARTRAEEAVRAVVDSFFAATDREQ